MKIRNKQQLSTTTYFEDIWMER